MRIRSVSIIRINISKLLLIDIDSTSISLYRCITFVEIYAVTEKEWIFSLFYIIWLSSIISREKDTKNWILIVVANFESLCGFGRNSWKTSKHIYFCEEEKIENTESSVTKFMILKVISLKVYDFESIKRKGRLPRDSLFANISENSLFL